MSESDISGDHRYLMIYPIYFNVNRSLNYGRRLPKALCCEKPNISDVKNACDKLGLSYILQNKTHPQDFGNPGRIAINILNDENQPKISEITNRKIMPTCRAVIKQSTENTETKVSKKKGKKGKK